jgi:hypothetical protein
MVRQIREEFQSVFEVTLAYEPEYEQIMGDLQRSIESAEAGIAAAGLLNARASSSQLISPAVTPLVHRQRYLPLPISFRSSRRAHRTNSSPTPCRQRSRSQSPPSSPISSKSKSRTNTPPTPNKQRHVPPPPKFSCPSPLPPPSDTPLKKRKRAMAYVELTPWIVKKRRMLAQGQSYTAENVRAPLMDFPHPILFGVRKHNPRTQVPVYPQDRPVRVVGEERHSSADTASSCSPSSSRTMLIASRRYGRAPSPSPVPCGDEDDDVPETSEESTSDSDTGSGESDPSEEDEDEPVVLPTSDDPLNLFALPDSSPRVRLVRNKRLRPLSRLRLAFSP